jgi:transcription antitermination protein NusB
MTDHGSGVGSAPRPGTADPRRSRQRALKILFQADLRGQDPRDALGAILDDPQATALLDDVDTDEVADAEHLDAYTVRLVDGVATHTPDLDRLIEKFARRWTVQRMPVVDRNVLRLGAYELLHEDDLSPAVVIDEALELAKALSTDNSARFVNGVLESVRRWHEDTRRVS